MSNQNTCLKNVFDTLKNCIEINIIIISLLETEKKYQQNFFQFYKDDP